MTYAESQLNGSADFRLGLDVYMVSQSQSGNYTTFFWALYLQNPTGNPTWTNSTQYWSAVIGGVYRDGTFTMPYAERGTKQKLLASGYQNVGHDANGFRPGFANTGGLDTNHASVGDGNIEVWVDAPRIPKTPLGPDAAPTFDQITPNSMRVNFGGAYDHRGATPDYWLLRVSKNANPEVQPFTDYQIPTSQYSRVLTGLDPSTTYYAKVYSHNAIGYSNGSATGNATTLAAAKISDDGAFENADIFISKGGAWVPSAVGISKAGAWVNTQ